MAELKLDPKGYFLIRLKNNQIEVAFCNYQDKKGWYDNKIELTCSGSKEEILKWVKENNLYSQEDHYDYLVRELTRAEECLKNKNEYVQK